MPDAYTWAIVGVCASIGACVLALLVFVLIFCRTRLKEDSNVRKRIITKKAFPERPPTPEPEPEPEPDFYPVPVVLPPPPPQPRPLFIPRPIRLPPPQPPLPLPPPPPPQAPPPAPAPAPAQPNEPTIIIRTVYEEGNSQRPAERVVRRRSWAGDQDELVFVKKIRGRKRGYKKRKSDDSSSSSSSSSDSSDSDDDYQTRNKRRQNNAARPAMVPMGYVVPRLDPYDLAVPNYGPYSRGRPGVVNLGQLNTGPSFGQVGQPTILLPGTSGNQPGYVSVLMPQQ